MRQFLTLRFWFAIAGVLGLFVALMLFLRSEETSSFGPPVPAVETRKIDLVAAIATAELSQADATARPSQDGTIVDGVVVGEMRLVLDERRTMVVHAGTQGADQCGKLETAGACAVVADLLGDAVLWFALVPVEQRNTIVLPPIDSFPRSGWARLENGWELPLARTVARACDEESSSLRDFVTRFGPSSATTVDLTVGRVTRVTCAAG